jgi:hypothetical protein
VKISTQSGVTAALVLAGIGLAGWLIYQQINKKLAPVGGATGTLAVGSAINTLTAAAKSVFADAFSPSGAGSSAPTSSVPGWLQLVDVSTRVATNAKQLLVK